MRQVVEDNQKQRLTEDVEIVTAIQILRLRGVDDAELLRELVSLFYLDLDRFNEVLKAA